MVNYCHLPVHAGIFAPPYSINNNGMQLPINTKVRFGRYTLWLCTNVWLSLRAGCCLRMLQT